MFIGFLITMIVRLFFCAQVPIETSDLYRHLGFTAHFFEDPKAFYWLEPARFPHEFWSQFWTEIGYIYPPLALLFFAVFGSLGIGFFWVKLVLTLFDFVSAALIGRATSWWAGLIVFSAPIGVWYTSHEGQYESLVTLLVIISVLSARGRNWIMAGASFMLALQAKQFAILIAPYLAYEIFTASDRTHPLKAARSAARMLIGFVGAFLPFIPFYYWRHDLWLLPLQNQENLLNPDYWPLFWSSSALDHFNEVSSFRMIFGGITTTAPLLVLALFLARGDFLRKLPQAMPCLGFWMLIKSMAWVMNWYINIVPGLAFALWRYRRWMILLFAIHWLQCGQQIASLWGDIDGEEAVTIARFHQCVWHADYRAKP